MRIIVWNDSAGEPISDRVRRVLDLLERSYADPNLRLDTVALTVSVSAHHLSYLIKKETGTGFREHLGAIRLRRAQHHLLTTLMSVKEIAASVGYNSTSSFDREFRRARGCSPTEWRRQAQTT